jgi:hypothetical protein
VVNGPVDVRSWSASLGGLERARIVSAVGARLTPTDGGARFDPTRVNAALRADRTTSFTVIGAGTYEGGWTSCTAVPR